jgi:hypothetical protein
VSCVAMMSAWVALTPMVMAVAIGIDVTILCMDPSVVAWFFVVGSTPAVAIRTPAMTGDNDQDALDAPRIMAIAACGRSADLGSVGADAMQ